ncbi:MAG: radical SAM protein [Candidatus Methanomethylicia archaeon]
MLRLSEYIKISFKKQVKPQFDKKIVIWNLTNNCNLSCIHCYSSAKLKDSQNVFNRENIPKIVEKLQRLNVGFVILSGGEPMLFKDLYYTSSLLKEKSINVSLSTNGLMINKENIDILKRNFDYIGISIDGKEEIHDNLRGFNGAYKKAVKSIELLLSNGIKTGLRFTLTNRNYQEMQSIFKLAKDIGISKVYISHLVDSGRAKKQLYLDKSIHKSISQMLIEKAFEEDFEIVTGNNEQDAVLLFLKFNRSYPLYVDYLYENLKNWGGNKSGSRIININHLGYVKPDPFFDYYFTNILHPKAIDRMKDDKVFKFLNDNPRKLSGKCKNCNFLPICNGGSRARAFNEYGDFMMEDPECFI